MNVMNVERVLLTVRKASEAGPWCCGGKAVGFLGFEALIVNIHCWRISS